MTVKLIGADDGTIDGSTGEDGFYLQQFIASATGTCSEIRIKVSNNGNVKVAVYADVAGSPGTPGGRLAKRDTSTAVTTGWNTLALESSCFLTSGTKYWLALSADSMICGYDLTTGTWTYKYSADSYEGFTFPDPAGTGFSPQTNVIFFIAGWGGDLAKSLSDVIAIVDSPAKQIDIPKADTITIADLAAYFKALYLSLADTISIADSFSKVSEFNPSKADSIAITDIPAKAIGIPKADTLAIADLISKGFGLSQADSMAIADVLTTKDIGLGKADTITIADLFAKVSEFNPALADTVTIADVISKGMAITKADAITILEGQERIIGSANVSVDDIADQDTFYLSKFTALKSGDVVRIWIYCQGGLTIKVAMYEDNAGEPGDLMNAVNTAQVLTYGWNELVFPATTIVQGADYWLAFNSG